MLAMQWDDKDNRIPLTKQYSTKEICRYRLARESNSATVHVDSNGWLPLLELQVGECVKIAAGSVTLVITGGRAAGIWEPCENRSLPNQPFAAPAEK